MYPIKTEKSSTKMDKFETESQIQASVPNATIEELRNIIRQAANNSEDKYKILEARDRLIRLTQVKSHSLATAKATKGTCPDMCPEKERLMRESQRQVAPYELMEGNEYRINHMTAVKQYSRSSADQEEPLAHELRPVGSLKMTMNYLLNEIADLSEEEGTNLAEWFHFLWDRMRSIRKDITQQELCCVDSVELVEQCARFHIVCSERLCAEELAVFDKKINTENLTKCLQTLKYMYHDLRIRGITCKNESEFRAYIILLNLNNGNFMWDVQKLPVSIQNSPEVKFAICVYSSIDSNNFSKFFKLVHKTTYLNACILLRYFNQVRVKALSIMVKAYCRTMSTAFPLYELIDILGFEDENEALYFCEQVGLSISNDEMYIMLNRQNFSLPMSNMEQGRALNVVEFKRTSKELSIGECIAGGKRSEKLYKSHTPYNSFDSHGYLKPECISVKDQNASNDTKQNDPYEFLEDDVRPSKTLKSHNNDIKNVNEYTSNSVPLFPAAKNIDIFSKKQTLSIDDQSVVSKSSTSLQNADTSMLVTSKSNAQSTFGSEYTTNAARDVTFQTNVSSDTNSEEQKSSDVKSNIFNTSSNDDVKFTNKQSGTSNFSMPLKNTHVFFNPRFSSPAKTSAFETISPFAMAMNKSIFSGASQGNIFAKPAVPSTIFTTSHTNKQVTSKAEERHEKSTEIPTSKGDFKVPQSIPSQKERTTIEVEKRQKKLKESKTNLERQKEKLQKLEYKKKMQKVEKEAKEVANVVQNEVMKEICSSVVKEEIDRIAMYDVLSRDVTKVILSQVVQEICKDVLDQEIHFKKKLREIQERVKNRAIMRCYKVWRQYTFKKKQRREALDDTPVWLQKRSIEECAKLLYHQEQDVVIKNMRRKRFKSDTEEINKISLAPIEVIVHAGIKENLKSSDIETIPSTFWKMVISWPDLENRVVLWQHKKIMNKYLCPDDYTTEPIIKTYRPNPYETLNICIRHFEGLISEHHLIGMDALLFIIAASEELNAVVKRLKKTILSRYKLMPIPIVLVVLGKTDLEPENIGATLDLEMLLESGYVSEYTVLFERTINEKIILRLTQSAVLWLTVNKSPLVPLEMDYLREVLNACLTEELWLRIQDHSAFNVHLSSGLESPTFIINLHNEAVTYLMDILLDQESLLYTDFPPEFRKLLNNYFELPCSYEYFDDAWKKEKHREELRRVVNNFILPHWRFDWPITDDWELQNSVTRYCQEALTDSNYTSVSCNILSNMFLVSNSSEKSNFMDVLLQIVKEKIRLLKQDLKVVYNKNHVKHFRTLPWWFKSSVLTNYIMQEELKIQSKVEEDLLDEPLEKKQKMDTNNEDINDKRNIYKPTNQLSMFCKETRDQVLKVHGISQQFERDFKKQKLKSQMMEKLLEEALLQEDVHNSLVT